MFTPSLKIMYILSLLVVTGIKYIATESSRTLCTTPVHAPTVGHTYASFLVYYGRFLETQCGH